MICPPMEISILKMESLETAEKAVRLSFLIRTFKNVYKRRLKSFSYQAKITITVSNTVKNVSQGWDFCSSFSRLAGSLETSLTLVC